VVSAGEFYRVKAAGGDTSKVIFAGVGKTDEEIRYAIENNVLMFNVESEAELDAIAQVTQKFEKIAPVALRLNPDIDAKTHAKTAAGKQGNKFGMDNERAEQPGPKVPNGRRLGLPGIHMHPGSAIPTTEPYAEAGTKAAAVGDKFRKNGHDTRWINLGGG